MAGRPTTDLYFRNALAPFIAPRWWPVGWPAGQAAPIRACGAHSFSAGRWRVLLREDAPAAMRAALDHAGPLAYLVDDDFAAAASCPALPEAYRQRLAAFARGWHAALLARADVVLAASAPLAARLAGQPGLAPRLRLIEPFWRESPADQAHFAPLTGGAPLRIAHLGSASHGAALAALAPALAALLDRHPACQFTYFARAPVDPALEAHPRARRQQPMAWPEYRRWLARQRFHLALYPLLDNGFDRARSASKLAEHAVAGAVGVYPAGWAPGAALAAAGGALLAPDRVELWPAAMDRLIGQIMQKHHKLAQIAAQAAKTLSINDPCAKQRQIWSNSLDLCLA